MEQKGELVESENYRERDVFSYKEIVLKQLNRVVFNFSREMKEGFWVYSNNPNITPQKIKYIGDSRKELMQSINCFHDLLMPKFDSDVTTQSKETYKKIEEIKKDDKNKKEYLNEKLKLYRELFQQLCLFLERLGWLESEAREE